MSHPYLSFALTVALLAPTNIHASSRTDVEIGQRALIIFEQARGISQAKGFSRAAICFQLGNLAYALQDLSPLRDTDITDPIRMQAQMLSIYGRALSGYCKVPFAPDIASGLGLQLKNLEPGDDKGLALRFSEILGRAEALSRAAIPDLK